MEPAMGQNFGIEGAALGLALPTAAAADRRPFVYGRHDRFVPVGG